MSDQSHLARYLGDFPRGRIACVGDVMLDRFVAGSVERISPEAPIPVLKVARETAMPGGAGNVAVNVASLGGQARLLGVVGDDGAARELGALLDDTDGVESTLVTDAARPTTVKTRYVAAGQQLLRADYEDTAPVAAATEAELRAAVGRVIGEANAVVVSDYGKGALTDAVLAEVMEKAGAAGVPVIVDPSGRDYGRYRGAAVVSPNRAELEGATGLSCEEDADVEQAARTIIDSCGVASLLVTRGASGLSLITADGAHHVPVQAREVFDVSGAGDTVLAAFALAGAAGASPLDAAHLANAAAGIVVAKVGTAVVRTDDLAEALHSADVLASDAKVKTRAPALDIIQRWRARGDRIGFTNGCFDLVHAGHVSLLAQAKAACDRLVVGLNSDESVQRLKGEGRPLQPEASRSLVLASLSGVDLVVVFAEDTPQALIEAIRPDVLVKGADYSVDDVVGADIVQGYGGKVLLAEIMPGHSTTDTIARMTARTSG
ncbi:MAG: D-glycero-beta-D-manno-heptose-7-phosphate kinase [Proteobacteria bacterium]|nr:D-glycero-beta-D-manno-heptose-7-phosphate kinase [Pseudomonadota bacterium]